MLICHLHLDFRNMSLTPPEKAIKQTVRGMELTDLAECIIPLSTKPIKGNILSKGVFLNAWTVIKSLKMARVLEIEPSISFATWKLL